MNNKRTLLNFIASGCLAIALTFANAGCTPSIGGGGDGCTCDCKCTAVPNAPPNTPFMPTDCGDRARNDGESCNTACIKLSTTGLAECHDATLPPPNQPPPPPSGCTPPDTLTTFYMCLVCDGVRADGEDFVVTFCNHDDAESFVQSRDISCDVEDGKCDDL